ncbi:hypothetical protein PSY47_23355, partial [Shigella flexneri]|nr:hypothetical protein [Shigella flexneri]
MSLLTPLRSAWLEHEFVLMPVHPFSTSGFLPAWPLLLDTLLESISAEGSFAKGKQLEKVRGK